MLCVKKVIVICREVNSQTGQIAVYNCTLRPETLNAER